VNFENQFFLILFSESFFKTYFISLAQVSWFQLGGLGLCNPNKPAVNNWEVTVLNKLLIQPRSALPLHFSNEGAEALANNPEHHTRTKHINARYHFVCYCAKTAFLRSYTFPHTTACWPICSPKLFLVSCWKNTDSCLGLCNLLMHLSISLSTPFLHHWSQSSARGGVEILVTCHWLLHVHCC
jgi:hypothetical protein